MDHFGSDCSPEWRRLVSCQADGELDDLDAARLESHLAGCLACTAWAAEVSSLAALMASDQREPEMRLAPQSLRRRRARASLVTASAASVAAAAVAAFALQLNTGSAVSNHGRTSGPRASASQRFLDVPAFAGIAIEVTAGTHVLLNPVQTA